MRSWISLSFVLVIAAGCTNAQLRCSTINQVTTLTELQHQLVLDNLAAFTCNPETIPFQANLNSGVTQVVDAGAVSSQVLARALLSLGLSRGIVDQWSMTPVTDELTLRLLRVAYRRAIGYEEDLYTDDLANRVAHRLKGQVTAAGDVSTANTVMFSRTPGLPGLLDRAGWSGDANTGFKPDDLAIRRWRKDTNDVITLGSDRIVQVGERLTKDNLVLAPVLVNGVPVVLEGEKDPRLMVATPYAAEVRRQVMALNEYITQIYPGWVCQGSKKDVPKGACNVGNHKDCHCHCYVWVPGDERDAFEDFVLRSMRLAMYFQQVDGGANSFQSPIFSPVPAAAF